jgi:probable addiction module antidote protein
MSKHQTSSYKESLLEALKNPDEASAYLNAAMEDSEAAFLKALRNVAQAHSITRIAAEAGVQRETLYRSLAEGGNPTLGTLASVLSALGMRLSVVSRGAR